MMQNLERQLLERIFGDDREPPKGVETVANGSEKHSPELTAKSVEVPTRISACSRTDRREQL